MILGSSQDSAKLPVGVILVMVTLLAVGFWLRARHLGDLGLIADEGVQAQAVQRILEHGVPKFDSGMYYKRALPFLYAEAGAAKIFGLNELSLRLPAVLFGVAVIWAAFLLGKTVFNWRVGLLTATVMTFSVWEIEMSRYARFYTVFQFMYLISLISFYRGFIAGERTYKLWFVVTACITFIMHDLGVMLATSFLALLPSGFYSLRRKWLFGLSAAGLVGLWSLNYSKLFGVMNVTLGSVPHANDHVLTPGAFERVHELLNRFSFQLPDISLVSYLSWKHPLLFLTLVVAALTATTYLIYRSLRKNDGWRASFAVLIVWLAFMYQVGLVIVVLAAYLVFFLQSARTLFEPPLRVACAAGVFCLLVWALVPAIDPAVSGMRLGWAMFSYPNFYDQFLKWYLWGWPFLTAVFAIGVIQLAAYFIKNRRALVPLFMLGVIFIPAIAASLFQPNDDAARYTFHLYPLMVIIFAAVAAQTISYCVSRLAPERRLTRGLTATALAWVALLISQDANPIHAWSVGDGTYRDPRHPIRSILVGTNVRNHLDYKNPSLYVQERLGPQDKVIIAGGPVTIAICHYYIGRVDYALSNRPSIEMLHWKDGKLADTTVNSEIIAVEFEITDQSFESLKSQRVPSDILLKLQTIKNREFSGEPIFLNALKTALGVEEAYKYKSVILKVAVHRTPEKCCRIKQIIESHSEGHTWFVGNWDNLMTDDRDYSDSSKEYLRSLIRTPDFWGLDGQTFAVKLRRPVDAVALYDRMDEKE